MCLRTQQIIGHESGLTETADPLAGSYFVERLTDEMEAEITRLMERVAEQGGMVEAVRSGWLEGEIGQARVDGMRAMETGEKVVVGVNAFRSAETEPDISIHAIRAEEWGAKRAAYLREYRAARDQAATDEALRAVTERMRGAENMLPVIMDALRAQATMGEIHRAMREAHGFEIPA
jgi:methylmalonyl-CoA mutase N-terminal domain/subunit